MRVRYYKMQSTRYTHIYSVIVYIHSIHIPLHIHKVRKKANLKLIYWKDEVHTISWDMRGRP